LHHVALERWSRGDSMLHQRDPRAKIVALAAFLMAVATADRGLPVLAGLLVVLLCGALRLARLPLRGTLARSALVLPFTLFFGAVCWAGGDAARGAALVLKSYLSALSVLLLVGTTPLPDLLRGMEALGAPRFLLMVAQFLYRYLFVICEEARQMAQAAASRGSTMSNFASGRARFVAAAGALAVLFTRSYSRAGEIHRAMLARAFPGHFRVLKSRRFRLADAAFLFLAGAVPIVLRMGVERFF